MVFLTDKVVEVCLLEEDEERFSERSFLGEDVFLVLGVLGV